MAKRKPVVAEVDPAWVELCARFPAQTELKSSLYALPSALIERIQAETKGFFSAEQLAFEEALGAGGRTGFFRGWSFRYPLLGNSSEPDEECDVVDRKMRQLTIELIQATGAGEREVDEYFALEKRMKEQVVARERGYAGWLVTDPGFHISRALFQRAWSTPLQLRDSLPQLPVSYFGEKIKEPPKADIPFHVASCSFLQAWCLKGLCTWELPIPVQTNVATSSVHPAGSLGDAGCTLFVPWYLARDQKLTLRDIFGRQALVTRLRHLQPWLEKNSEQLGHERFGQMLQFYVYFELALKSRYADKLFGKTKAIDRALGHFFKQLDPDSDGGISVGDAVKKTREAMSRRLKDCEVAVSQQSKKPSRSISSTH